MDGGKVTEWGEDFFCFCLFVCFFFFCFSLFNTTKICFESTRMEIFYREKAFHGGEKIRKLTLPPQKNFPVTPLTVYITSYLSVTPHTHLQRQFQCYSKLLSSSQCCSLLVYSVSLSLSLYGPQHVVLVACSIARLPLQFQDLYKKDKTHTVRRCVGKIHPTKILKGRTFSLKQVLSSMPSIFTSWYMVTFT